MKKRKLKSNNKISNIMIAILFIITIVTIGAGIIKDKMQTAKLKEIATLYNQKELEKEKNNKAIITFIDDDGFSTFVTDMKPIFDANNIKCSLAIITDNVDKNGYMSKEQLLELREEGYDTLSHSKTHSENIFRNNLENVSNDNIENEFKESKQWFDENGFNNVNTIVYPYGDFQDKKNIYIDLAEKYYKYGLSSVSNYNNSDANHMYLNRYEINKNQDFNTDLKPLIDKCINEKGWLILYTHSYNKDKYDSDYLMNVIDYIKQNKVDILNFSDAIEIKKEYIK